MHAGKSGFGWSLIVLFPVLVTVLMPGAGAAPANKSSAPSDASSDSGTETPSKAESSPAATPRCSRFYETFPEARLDASDESTGGSPAPRWRIRVATIPDPIDSGLAYLYDTVLQALRLGFERGGPGKRSYHRDSSWLPWEDRRVAEKERTESEGSRETTPGVILFRSADSTDERGALLLVGETPTAGVHRTSFETALEIAARLDRGTVQVIGPTFSGSTASMIRGLESWKAKQAADRQVQILSGAASGGELRQRFEQGRQWLTFRRTTVPEPALECAFFRFARDRLGVETERGRCAQDADLLGGFGLVRESGTQFGADDDPEDVCTDKNGEKREDALAASGWKCPVRPEVTLTFPFGISVLRDAYEEMDAKHRTDNVDATVGRKTALDVSLKEKRRPLDAGGEPSPRTNYARDIALSNLLSQVAQEGMRYVAIRATDIGDAIFLARRVRDVAPDVRLVFLSADALLLHPAFRHDLLGSFVVSPYPFFGANEFSPRRRDLDEWDEGGEATSLHPAGIPRSPERRQHHLHTHDPFENDIAEGTYNAVLASSEFGAKALAEYVFFDGVKNKGDGVLPVWISTISTSDLLPIAVSVPAACDGSVYGARAPALDTDLCLAAAGNAEQLWKGRRPLAKAELDVDPDVTPPKLWHFVLAALLVGAIADRLHQRWKRQAMPLVDVRELDERLLDLALGRTKFRFYAAIRTLVFAVGFGYMGCIQGLALATYGSSPQRPFAVLALTGAVVAFLACCWAVGRDISGYRQHRAVAESLRDVLPARVGALPATPSDREDRPGRLEQEVERVFATVGRYLGVRDPVDLRAAVETSFAQLRLLTGIAVALALFFVAMICWDLHSHHFSARLLLPLAHSRPEPDMTMFVLRSLPLVNGVSPSMPFLICLVCVYLWVWGRMARLGLAHGVTMVSPNDGVVDAVCTPIAFVLHKPKQRGGTETSPEACAMRQAERSLLNAIWRPSTRPRYFAALCGTVALTVLVFKLKPPSTLEFTGGTLLLCGGLGLCAVLIGATLLQLILYWISLERLLKRVAEHPLGRGFKSVAEFVRDSIEDLVARPPDDLLRLTGCARVFEDLIQSARVSLPEEEPDNESEFRKAVRALTKLQGGISTARENALGGIGSSPEVVNGSQLGPLVFTAASHTCALLARIWSGQLKGSGSGAPDKEKATEQTNDALAPVARAFSREELTWLREAQAFVATSVAILVGRHVRQFQPFLYSLTGCALLLVLALSSYPFEPQRLLLTAIWVVMGAVVACCFWVFIQLDLNTLLSHISDSKPGKLTLDAAFALRVVGWVVVPLLSVAAAQYPQVSSTLLSWLEPFGRALK